ncbi:hypothetical protein POTOM_043282 [Populus tomentosa]|uniref:Uncharacterized protein n=1 Tax=Populus tomentosa TaxID=118781 RepID=A0A8X8CH74_POPTO|nr:hypothetical protein POTOM_043282 [Populus tomentosa]
MAKGVRKIESKQAKGNFIAGHDKCYLYNNIKSGHLLAHFTCSQLIELFQDESLTYLSHQGLDPPIQQ